MGNEKQTLGFKEVLRMFQLSRYFSHSGEQQNWKNMSNLTGFEAPISTIACATKPFIFNAPVLPFSSEFLLATPKSFPILILSFKSHKPPTTKFNKFQTSSKFSRFLNLLRFISNFDMDLLCCSYCIWYLYGTSKT